MPSIVTFEGLDPDSEALDLQNQELGKKGAQRLARALLEHQCLRELNLACTNLGDAGCTFMAGALSRNSSLQSLNLRNNRIGDEGIESIAEGLMMSFKERGTEMLTELNVGHNCFGDHGLQVMAEVIGLGFLQLLDLSNLKMVTAEGWETFCSSLNGCRLSTLKLRQNALGEAALTLALALKMDVGALEELDLSLCSVGGKAASQLLQLPLRQLQLLGTSNMDPQELGSALVGNTALEILDLCNCHLGRAAAAELANVLRPRPASLQPLSLKALHLDRNQLGFEGAVVFSKALQGRPAPGCRLQVLTLRENGLGDGGVGAIAEALEHNMVLKELDLSSNEVGDLGAQSMGLLLKKEPRLAALSLKSNQIGDEGAEALAQGMEQNSWLEELDLSKNHIKMLGVSKLCAALEHNGYLNNLVLEGNEVKMDIIESVEQLAADVMLRRERQPPKIKALHVEEIQSPRENASETEAASESSNSSASEEAREEEPAVIKRDKQDNDTMSLVDDFVQRFLSPHPEAARLDAGGNEDEMNPPATGSRRDDRGGRLVPRPGSAGARPPRPLESKVLPRSASDARNISHKKR